MIDRKTFYREIRKSLFRDGLSQAQVDGLNRLLDTWFRYYSARPITWLAYCLATSYHETGRTMEPVQEKGGRAYLMHNYDVTGRNPERARRYGNTQPGDGVRYSGKGDVQLTWKDNYGRATAMLRNLHSDFARVDLVRHPEQALDPRISALILFEGCITGLFTRHKLGDYLDHPKKDYRGARAVVNGTDRAALIAGHAEAFEEALTAAARAFGAGPQDEDLPPGDPARSPETGDGKPWWQSSTILSAIVSGATGIVAAVNTPWGAAALGIVAISAVATLWIVRERLVKAREWGI